MFSFAMMHPHNFNICSLMCLSFSIISSGSQWTANKQMYTYSYSPYKNFILYQSLLQHVSYICLFLKQLLCHVK